MESKSMFLTAEDVQEELNISKSQAYKIIRSINANARKKNPNIIVIAGRVNKHFYDEAMGIVRR